MDNNFIVTARKMLEMTQVEFAAEVNVSVPTIIALEKGNRKPQAAVAEKIERMLRGRGLLHAPWTPDEADMLNNYRDLSERNKANILGVIQAMDKEKKMTPK